MSTQPHVASARSQDSGWSALFWSAFSESRNAMTLLDDARRHVEVNGAYVALLGYPRSALVGRFFYEFRGRGQIATDHEWRAALSQPEFTGTVELLRADGQPLQVSFAAHPEVVTGRRLVLGVALQAVRTVRRVIHDGPETPARRALSARELEVIELIARGMLGPEIADELHVSHNTVRTHVRNAMTRTASRSRAHLVAKTLAEGLLWDPQPSTPQKTRAPATQRGLPF